VLDLKQPNLKSNISSTY